MSIELLFLFPAIVSIGAALTDTLSLYWRVRGFR